MRCTSCAFLLTKLLDLLLYSFPYVPILCIVIYNLVEDGSWEASGHCEGLDLNHFGRPRSRVAQVHVRRGWSYLSEYDRDYFYVVTC
jgi:hypothetical protein